MQVYSLVSCILKRQTNSEQYRLKPDVFEGSSFTSPAHGPLLSFSFAWDSKHVKLPNTERSWSFPLLLGHRIIELFVLKRTLKGCLVQLPCKEQGHLQLKDVVQNQVQPDCDCLQGQVF